MTAEGRPVPKDGIMDQDEQARLLVRTGDGVAPENEAALLEEEWGPADAQGVYALPEFVRKEREGDDA